MVIPRHGLLSRTGSPIVVLMSMLFSGPKIICRLELQSRALSASVILIYLGSVFMFVVCVSSGDHRKLI